MAVSKNKPKSPLRRGFKAEAERKSIELRSTLGLRDHDPLPAKLLAEHLGIRVLTPTEIPGITADILNPLLVGNGRNEWSAAIFIKNDRKFIIHNPTHSTNRQESNLMHELGHAICNHKLQAMETAILGCALPLRKYHDELEAEAEHLGSCLQLPQKALFYYHCILKKSVNEISEAFNASIQMVNYRLATTGVNRIKF